MAYVDAFLGNQSFIVLVAILAILIACRIRRVKLGHGRTFFEMSFGTGAAEKSAGRVWSKDE